MQKGKSKRFVVIDGKSVFYRGYYAMPNLRTIAGTPTGGVYGFAVMSLEVIKRLQPDYVAVAWDKPKTNIRKRLELYPEYKAGRKPAPADFYEQIPILHDLLSALGWPLYELDDYEADDIIGSLALQASKADIETIIVTSDLDMLQVVNDNIKVYALKSGLSNIELYSPSSFEAKHHIKVDQYLDLKSLKGDSSDNIPGVLGIGEKTATNLLQQFHTLDNIYENLELISPTVSKKLSEGKKLAYLSKELARIWIDAPVKFNPSEVDGSKIDVGKLTDILDELQFNSLKNKLANIFPEYQEEHLKNNQNKLKIPTKFITKDEDIKTIKIDKECYIYTRTAQKNGKNPLVIIIGNSKEAYSLDLDKINSVKVGELLGMIKGIISYDTKNVLKVFLEYSNYLPEVIHDIKIGPFLINSLISERSLEDMTNLNYSIADLDNQDLLSRGGEIISSIKSMYEIQKKELAKLPKIEKLAKEIEWPTVSVLARMEKVGIELDSSYLKTFSIKIERRIKDLEATIYSLSEQEFNISSPIQLSKILFEKLNLPKDGIKKTKTGYSTAANELDKLRDKHEIINHISNYREVVKLKTTYIDTLPKQVDENGAVHTNFSLIAAQTGRLSSLEPNLQNIPTRTDLGRNIRKAFISRKGKIFVSADYSQFEFRLAAVLAKDQELIELFNSGADIYTSTAALVYGRSSEDVTKQMRDAAKTINLGILYGMSAHGLSQATAMTFTQAKDFIEKYKAVRRPLFNYLDELVKKAQQDGYLETMFGRRRYFPDINSSNFVLRQAAIRAAINMPIQGTEADLMKMAMVDIQKEFLKLHNDCNILLQIHDSILAECPTGVSESVANIIKDKMENVYKLPIKLDVAVKIGHNWGEV